MVPTDPEDPQAPQPNYPPSQPDAQPGGSNVIAYEPGTLPSVYGQAQNVSESLRRVRTNATSDAFAAGPAAAPTVTSSSDPQPGAQTIQLNVVPPDGVPRLVELPLDVPVPRLRLEVGSRMNQAGSPDEDAFDDCDDDDEKLEQQNAAAGARWELRLAGARLEDWYSLRAAGLADGATVACCPESYHTKDGSSDGIEPNPLLLGFFVDSLPAGQPARQFFDDDLLSQPVQHNCPQPAEHSVVWGTLCIPGTGAAAADLGGYELSELVLRTRRGYLSTAGLISQKEWTARYGFGSPTKLDGQRGWENWCRAHKNRQTVRVRSGQSRTVWGLATHVSIVDCRHSGDRARPTICTVDRSGNNWSPMVDLEWVRSVKKVKASFETALSNTCVAIKFESASAKPMIVHNITDGMRQWWTVPGDPAHYEVIMNAQDLEQADQLALSIRTAYFHRFGRNGPVAAALLAEQVQEEEDYSAADCCADTCGNYDSVRDPEFGRDCKGHCWRTICSCTIGLIFIVTGPILLSLGCVLLWIWASPYTCGKEDPVCAGAIIMVMPALG